MALDTRVTNAVVSDTFNMPAKLTAQAHLMRAAEHGGSFPKAQAIRQSMTHSQIHDFTLGPTHPAHPHKNLGGYLHPKKAR